MWLSAPPAQTTLVRFESDDPQALLIRPSTLQFTAANWNIPQPFALFALTDLQSSANRNVIWRILFAGNANPFSARITDNGQEAAIAVAQLDFSADPGDIHYIERERRGRGHIHVLDAHLDGQPGSRVTINIATEPPSIQPSAGSLVFEPGNYQMSQRIEYTVNDAFERGTITFTVNNSLSGSDYRNVSHTVGIRLIPPTMLPSGLLAQLPERISRDITEGESVDAAVWLSAPPAQTTLVRFESGDPSGIAYPPEHLAIHGGQLERSAAFHPVCADRPAVLNCQKRYLAHFIRRRRKPLLSAHHRQRASGGYRGGPA